MASQLAGLLRPSIRRARRASRSWLSRVEWLAEVGSTNDVVAGWLRAGTPEVCVAVADRQAAGRGRGGRSWVAPSGAAVLASLGFTPTWLAPERHWRLAAIAALAMAEAAEEHAGLRAGTVRLKWPNDLVARDTSTGGVRKLAGVLGETEGLGTPAPRAVIGIGLNCEWARAEFPPELAPAMTSLAELVELATPVTPGTPGTPAASPARRELSREALLDAFLDRLGPLVEAVRAGQFPAEAWRARQVTTGAAVRLERPDGSVEEVLAVDVDPSSGALLARDADGAGPVRPVLVGEIRHVRLADPRATTGGV